MKNMNIQILTFHFVDNYGALLQAYALQETLKKHNKLVTILNYTNKRMKKKQSLFYFNTNLINSIVRIISLKKMIKRKHKSYMFRNKYLDISNKVKENSIFVLGSDQIWNPDITYEDMTYFSQGFNVPAISYAASLGKELQETQKDFLINGLKYVQNISVREETAKKCIKNIANKESQVVLDPTMLLTKEDWIKVSKKPKRMVKKPYIFVYTVDGKNTEFLKLVNIVSKTTNLPIVCPSKSLQRKSNFDNIIRTYDYEGPEEFLYFLINADYIVTSSFHGTVFSLLFEKQFISFVPSTNTSRLVDLMERIDCSDLLLRSSNNLTLENLYKKIDYEIINRNIKREREKSISWLLSALS